jgi:uncharacterized RDD family membrane protein YckC
VSDVSPSLPNALPPSALPSVHTRSIGGLWRRLFAALVDAVIVGIAANLLALPFFNLLSHVGPWGPLIGFCVASPYFAILNSGIGDGQTLGKSWMNLRVVDSSGEPVSFSRSALRCTVLVVPFLIDALTLPVTRTPAALQYLVGAISLLGAATAYLIVFNRHTRQGLHDLAANTFVASTDAIGEVKPPPIWVGHWIVLGTALVIYLAGSFAVGVFFGDKFTRWSTSLDQIESLDHVYAAGLSDQTWHSFGVSGSQKILVVQLHWTGSVDAEAATANQIAQVLLAHLSETDGRDLIRITFERGYNLGIASANSFNTFQFSPDDWRRRLQSTQAAPPRQL